jgi:hypothetical protein
VFAVRLILFAFASDNPCCCRFFYFHDGMIARCFVHRLLGVFGGGDSSGGTVALAIDADKIPKSAQS